MLVEYVFLTLLPQTIHMIGGVIPSGNEHANPTIAMVVNISINAIKPPIKQHNVVTQKAFLHLLRFSLLQSVFAILTITIIIKTKLES